MSTSFWQWARNLGLHNIALRSGAPIRPAPVFAVDANTGVAVTKYATGVKEGAGVYRTVTWSGGRRWD